MTWRYHPPAPVVNTKLVRDVVESWDRSGPVSPALHESIRALDKDLQRVDREQKKQDAETAAEKARDEARKKPPVTIQKVMGIVRKAGLPLHSNLGRAGSTTGLEVSYGDWDRRTWVMVAYRFSWDFGHTHGSREAGRLAEKKLINNDLFGTAMRAIRAAGLSAVAERKDSNYLTHYLKVTL